MLPESVATLSGMDCDFVLELGVGDWDDIATLEFGATRLKSLSSNQDASTSLLSALGKLYAGGVNPCFAALSQYWERNRLSLPTYPFQKKRYWITEIDDHVNDEEFVQVEVRKEEMA